MCVQVPPGVEAGVRDSIFVMMRYCDVNMICIEDCIDMEECEDPNCYELQDGTVRGPFFSADTVILVVE
jgi:hypothetical protein